MKRFFAKSDKTDRSPAPSTSATGLRWRSRAAIGATISGLVVVASVSTGGTPTLAYDTPTTSPGTETQGGYLPAPNPATYCPSPDYFGRWSKAQAVLDAGAGFQVVDTDYAPTHNDLSGPVANFTALTYTFYNGQLNTPGVWEGNPNSPLGITLGGGNPDRASGDVTFNQPLFFSQWVYPDTDLTTEGFDVTPTWATANTDLQAVALYGGDGAAATQTSNWTLTPSNATTKIVTTSGVNSGGETLFGRVQADFLGPLNGFNIDRVGGGNLGFIGGSGCAAIGLSKEATTPVWDPVAKTFVVDYTVRVFNNMPTLSRIESAIAAGQGTSKQDATNIAAAQSAALGNLVETNLQITDAIDLTGFTSAVVSTPPSSPDGATVNPDYDGSSDTALLLGTDSIEQEGLRTVTFSVTYTPDFAAQEWADCATSVPNQATTTAALEDVAVSDISDDGADPRPAEENTVGGVDDPTIVNFSYDCGVGLAKAVTAGPTSNGDGTYDVTYRMVATNTGTVPLYAVDIADDLSNAFGTAYVGQSVDSDTCATLTDGLAPAATCDKVITATIKPVDSLGPWNNSATVSAAAGSPDGAVVTDVSQNGANADPDGDGDPTNNNDATSLSLTPGVALVKTVTAGPTPVGDGTYRITYELVATNTGAAYLDTVVINDDLLATFGAAYVSGAVDSDTCATGGVDLGGTCTQVVTVTIRPGSTTTWTNNATVTGTAAGVDATASASADIVVPENPVIGLAKRLVSSDNNGDGTYTVTYQLLVENLGDTTLTDIAVTDDLATVFGSTLVSSASSSDTCTGITLTAPSLGSGQTTCSKTIVAVVRPAANLGPYDNTASVSGTSSAGTVVTDDSQNGLQADPEGDGPGDNSEPTRVSFVENPVIGLAKRIASGPFSIGDGTYMVGYELVAQNTGDVPLTGVVITDGLSDAFGSALLSSEITSDSCGDVTLLPPDPASSTAGETCVQSISVVVQPGTDLGPYDNSGTVQGVSPAGTVVSDVSQNGADVDPDGDGPDNNSEPTPVVFVEQPVIGLAKRLLSSENNRDGTYTVTYELVVENHGDTPLANVEVTDGLEAVFGPGLVNSAVVANSCADITLASPTFGEGETSCSTTIVAIVRPGANLGPYENSATVGATTPSGAAVTDVSHNGALTDPEGDGPGDNSDPTPVSFTEDPQIGLSKRVAEGPSNNGDGTYTVGYELVAKNTGDVPLTGIVIADDLANTFGSALVSSEITTDTCADATLLPPDVEDVTSGDTCTQTISAVVRPGTNLGPFDNSATVEALSPAGATVSDVSQDGADIDPEGDGPGDNSEPTPVSFEENPIVGLAKHITAGPTNNTDGTYTLTYELVASNMGDVPLLDVTIDDDLTQAFAGATKFSATITADTCTGAILLPLSPPGHGETCSIVVRVVVTPGANLGPYENSATVTATSPGGAEVTDISQDNPRTTSNPDVNADGDPTNDSDPTIVSFAEDPTIGIAKAAYNLRSLRNGQFAVDYVLVVENLGDVTIHDVTVVDNLDVTFGDVAYTVSDVASEQFTVFDGFTGGGGVDGQIDSDDLIDGSDSLAAGATATIAFTVTFTPAGNNGPFDNTAMVAGRSPAGHQVGDDSVDGANPDPDGDGDAGPDTSPTSIAVPAVGVTKSLVEAIPIGNGQYDVTYRLAVTNVGAVDLASVQVVDDLAATFTDADAWEVRGSSSPDLTVDSAFDGDARRGLLTGTDTMTVGQTSTIDLVVRVTALRNLGPFDNIAAATGVGPQQILPDGTVVAGPAVMDESLDVAPTDTNADGNGNGDPTDDTTPTILAFSENPQVSLSKRVVNGPTVVGTSFALSYELVATNTGDVPLSDVSVTDDLSGVFAAGSSISVRSVTASSPGTANPAYDGVNDINLLATTLLNPGESTTITIELVLSGVAGTSSLNSANVEGTSPTGRLVSDVSQDGVVADANGDGDPSNDSVPTPAEFSTLRPPTTGGIEMPFVFGALAISLLGAGLVVGARRRRPADPQS